METALRVMSPPGLPNLCKDLASPPRCQHLCTRGIYLFYSYECHACHLDCHLLRKEKILQNFYVPMIDIHYRNRFKNKTIYYNEAMNFPRPAKFGSFIDRSALSCSILCLGIKATPTAASSTIHKSEIVSPTATVRPGCI